MHGATVPQTRSSTGRSTPGRSGHSFSAPLPAAAPAVPDYKLRCDWTAPSHALASRESACRGGARIPMAAHVAIPTPPLPTERLLRVAAVSAATSLPLASTRNCDAGRLHRRRLVRENRRAETAEIGRELLLPSLPLPSYEGEREFDMSEYSV